MDRADERAASAADHAEAQAPAERLFCDPAIVIAFAPRAALCCIEAEHAAVGGLVGSAGCEIVEGFFGDPDDVVLDELAPSRAPSSGCFRQHSHSSTAQES